MSYLSSAYATGRVGQETQRRHPADSRGERRICLERLLGLYNRAHRTSRDLRLLVDQPLGRRQGRKVVPAGSGGTVATAKVKVELGDAERSPIATRMALPQ